MRLAIQTLGVVWLFTTCQTVAQDYFPISVGNQWVFRSRDGNDERLIEILTADQGLQVNSNGKGPKRLKNLDSEMVVVYDQINFRSHFVVRREGSWYQLARIQYKKRKNGKVRSITYIYPAGQFFVPKQMRVEKKWTISGQPFRRRKVDDEVLTINFKVVSMENFKVKAGRFRRVFRISEESEHQRKDRKNTTLGYLWLAPNIGPVRLKTVNEEVFELVRYSLTLDVKMTDQLLSLHWGSIKKLREK